MLCSCTRDNSGRQSVKGIDTSRHFVVPVTATTTFRHSEYFVSLNFDFGFDDYRLAAHHYR